MADNVIDYASAIARAMEIAHVAAVGRINVLITGEPEGARAMVAKAIHRRCRWPDGPFVKVECAKRSPADLELDLFGVPARDETTRLQSPGALDVITRSSRIVQASRGTLYIDHLTMMPPAIQARLSRLLDRREALIGPSQERVSLDIHAIVADQGQIDMACHDGRLRADLYDHVCALRIDLPGLMIEPADVSATAARMLEAICRRAATPPKELTSLAQILLTAVARRCNALELWLLLDDLVGRVAGTAIRVEDLLADILLEGPLSLGTVASLREARERFERTYIAAVLERHRGRIPHAARTLGMERTNLYRKLRHLEVEPLTARARNRRAAR